MADITIQKEDQGEVIDFQVESSDESEVELNKKPAFRKKIAFQPKKGILKPRLNPGKFNDSMLGIFSNPDKAKIPVENEEESEDGVSEEPDEEEDEDEFMNMPEPDEEEEEEEIQPSAGFKTIEDEKQDLLYKFYRMQSKGIPSRKFNMQSDIQEMRREYNKIVRDMEVKSSVKFSRRMLMACVTGIEFMNKRYDPFEVKLDGWSESVMENIDDYDNVFERLHDKYSSKVQMAPEIELLLSLVGSAFMFHLTNTMFSSMPNIKDLAKQNPDMVNNLMKTMSEATKKQNEPPPVSEDGKREMRGPVFDISKMIPSFNKPIAEPPKPPTATQRILNNQSIPSMGVNALRPVNNNTPHEPPQTNPLFEAPPPASRTPSVLSSSSEDSSTSKKIEISESFVSKGGTKRSRKRKISFDPETTINI